MERFIMRIAGIVVAVSAQYTSTKEYCAAYLCEAEPDFSVEITQQNLDFEQLVMDQEHAIEGLPVEKMDDALLEQTALQRKIAEKLFEYDVLLLHGSAIAVNGEAYLFTANSGTGKSTHTLLWRKMLKGAGLMVNDDKPFLRVTQDRVYACGSPWNGKHRVGRNVEAPLKAICILERGEQNEIRRISAGEILPMLLQQSSRPQQPRLLPKYLELLEGITSKIAFYQLKCNMEPEAAVIAYQAMSGDE